MVHPSESDGGGNDHLPDDAAETDTDSTRSVGRRSYIKLAGAALTGGVLGTNAVGNASASRTVTQKDGYEVWEISGNEVYSLDDGEVFENVLIDQTADGAAFIIRADGVDNWTIRNVGFRGIGDYDGHGGFHITASTPAGGHGLIENVYINQNINGSSTSSMGGIFAQRRHAGHIDIRHTWIEGNGNNATYGSDPGKEGADGSVAFENCYHINNTVSQFRIGTPESYVRNCVGVVDDPDLNRGPYPNTSSRRARGVWGRHCRNQVVENSAFYVNPDDPEAFTAFEATHIGDRSNGDHAELVVRNCDVNGDVPRLSRAQEDATVDISGLGHAPSVDVIDEGVPTRPVMAARGQREMPQELPSAEEESDLPRLITIEGTGDAAHYEFTVSGDLEKSTESNASIQEDDVIDGNTATGGVWGGNDSFRFEGEITDFTLDGDATIFVDGEEVDHFSGGGDQLPRLITIEGTGDVANYEFAVSGDLEKSTESNASINSDDVIGGSTATGGVVGGTDSYRFDGDLTDFTLDGDATVLLDGQVIDPADYGDEPDGHGHDHEIVVTTTEDPSELSYEFTTTGETVPLLDRGDNSAEENNDAIVHNDDGSCTTSGYTGNGYGDAFAYDGEITDFSPTTGPLEVRIDGETVDPATLADDSEDQGRDHEIVVTTTEDPSELSYEFTTTGEAELLLENGDDSAEENNDAIVHNDDGTCTVTGYTGNGYGDAFAYDGEITDFSPTTGPLEVRIDGDVVDPAGLGGDDSSELSRTLSVEGTGDVANYEFAVTGALEKSTENGASINSGDVIDGSTATGGVVGGTDSYRFDGELTDFTIDGDATVLLDGQVIDPADYGDGSDGSDATHLLSIEGTGNPTDYEFAVTGDVEKSSENDASINDGDVIDGSTVTGGVWGGTDSFRFDGELTDFALVGDAAVLLDGDEVDPADLA